MKTDEPKKLSLVQEIRALYAMTVGELRAKYADVFGEENRSRNKDYLIRRIAWRMQANVNGGLSERAKLRAQELANEADLRVRFPKLSPATVAVERTFQGTLKPGRDLRLPHPGTVLRREFRGQLIEVEVGADSFRWNGLEYKTLSAIARDVTGKVWNGYTFFGLGGAK